MFPPDDPCVRECLCVPQMPRLCLPMSTCRIMGRKERLLHLSYFTITCHIPGHLPSPPSALTHVCTHTNPYTSIHSMCIHEHICTTKHSFSTTNILTHKQAARLLCKKPCSVRFILPAGLWRKSSSRDSRYSGQIRNLLEEWRNQPA